MILCKRLRRRCSSIEFRNISRQRNAATQPTHVTLKIIANVYVEPIPRDGRSNPNLVLRPNATPSSSEQKDLAEAVKLLGEQCVYLLNTNPDPAIRWKYTCLFTRVHDTSA